DPTTEGVRHLKIKVVVDVGVQIYFSLFYQLHYRCPGKRLRNGSRAEQGSSRRDWSSIFDVCVPIALAKENAAILHNHDDRTSNILALKLHRHHAVQEGFDIA